MAVRISLNLLEVDISLPPELNLPPWARRYRVEQLVTPSGNNQTQYLRDSWGETSVGMNKYMGQSRLIQNSCEECACPEWPAC